MKNRCALGSYSLIFLLLFSCDYIEPITGLNKVNYEFPDKTIIKNTKKDKCVYHSTDKGINFLSDMEKTVLNVVAGKIDLSEEKKVSFYYGP